jgi:hypothetical protein
MKKLLTLAIVASLVAFGTGPRWAFADSTTTRFGITKPDVGSTNWGPKINSNYDIIDNAAGLAISNTFTNTNYFTGVVVVGGTTFSGTGQFEVRKDQAADTILRITNGTNGAGAQARELITTGGASAGDAYWTADVGAVQYSFGIDNSDSDKFKISLGTVLGTTDRIVIDPSGAITYPVQPSFLAVNATQQTNATGDGTSYKIPWATEIFDKGGNFALVNSTYCFTAPVTGKYHFDVMVYFESATTSHVSRAIKLNTTARNYQAYLGASDTTNEWRLSVLADMTAGDIAWVQVSMAGSTKTVSIGSGAVSSQPGDWFSGYLAN